LVSNILFIGRFLNVSTGFFLYAHHVLLSGATPGWATEENAVSGECQDTYDRLAYRLHLVKR
jgi:hypothetical protein